MNFTNPVPERKLGVEDTVSKRLRAGSSGDGAARNAKEADAFPKYLQQAAEESPPAQQSQGEADAKSAQAAPSRKFSRASASKAQGVDAAGGEAEAAGDIANGAAVCPDALPSDPFAALIALALQNGPAQRTADTGEGPFIAGAASVTAALEAEGANTAPTMGAGLPSTGIGRPMARPAGQEAMNAPEAPLDSAFVASLPESSAPAGGEALAEETVTPVTGQVLAGEEPAQIPAVLTGLVVTGRERHLAPAVATGRQDMGAADPGTPQAQPDSAIAGAGTTAPTPVPAAAMDVVPASGSTPVAAGVAPKAAASVVEAETAIQTEIEIDGGETPDVEQADADSDAQASFSAPEQGFGERGAGDGSSFAGSAPTPGVSASGSAEVEAFSSPSEQIASKLAAALAGSASNLVEEGNSFASGAPVQVLRIQLQPAELGEVTVRLTLKQNVLELHIDAAQRETARLVERDREMLSGMLSVAGYAVEGVTVRIGGGSAAIQSQGADSTGGMQHNAETRQDSGSSQQDRRSSGDGRQGGATRERFSGDGGKDAKEERDRAFAGGGVYI